MAEKKNLKSHVQEKKRSRAPGWHGNNRQISNTERRRLGLPELPSLESSSGRQKGAKNVKKLSDGRLQNQHNVIFTLEDRKKLENEVNKANRKRMQMLSMEGNLPRMKGGSDTGQNVATLQAMGKESDFIVTHKSKSLQQFKSREAFENYIKNLERVNQPNYITERVREYKRNHMTALENAFGDDAKDVIMKIRMMKPQEYMKLIQSDEDLEIGYLYDPSEASAKLNKIRNSLGMKLKEDYTEDI